MINVADALRPKGTQPAISLDLERALGAIQKGAEERLSALRSKEQQLGQGETSSETVPVLVGHIKKMELGDDETEDDVAKKDKEVGGRQTADKAVEEEEEEVGDEQMTSKDKLRKTRSTASVSKIKEQRRQAMVKEQERHWQEATKKGLGDVAVAEVDLEEAMMSEESEKQEEKDKEKSKEAEVYTKTHEKRAERSLSRAEKREQEEKRKKEEADRKAAQLKADRYAQEEVKQIIERAQLEEEELAVQKKMERKQKQ